MLVLFAEPEEIMPSLAVGLQTHNPGPEVFEIPRCPHGVEPCAAMFVYSGIYGGKTGFTIDLHCLEISQRETLHVPLAATDVRTQSIQYSWSLPAFMLPAIQVVYHCRLTGWQDGLDDLVLPVSSCQARQRSGRPSYLSVVVPNILRFEPEVSCRTHGEIVVCKGLKYRDGTINKEELFRANFESLRVDVGGNSASGTLVGYRTITYDSPAVRTVEKVSVRSSSAEGKHVLRAAIDLFLKPADTVSYNGTTFKVDSIAYIISPVLAYMEIRE